MTAPIHHIDPSSLAALPRAPGVYFFKGQGKLPLYIGKSIDIRSRVQAHLRASDEAAMLAQSLRVDFIETAGEVGALLLEAMLIKQQTPVFNVRLRRVRHLCTIGLRTQAGVLRPELVSAPSQNWQVPSDVHGLFGSVHAAQSKLRELAQLHRLCLGVLGLEKTGLRGCFGLQVKSCLGACVGSADVQAHNQRLQGALAQMRLHAWPFAGAVDLVERRADWTQRHRIHNWRCLHTWCSRTGQCQTHTPHGFDLDIYKILVKPIVLGTATVEPV